MIQVRNIISHLKRDVIPYFKDADKRISTKSAKALMPYTARIVSLGEEKLCFFPIGAAGATGIGFEDRISLIGLETGEVLIERTSNNPWKPGNKTVHTLKVDPCQREVTFFEKTRYRNNELVEKKKLTNWLSRLFFKWDLLKFVNDASRGSSQIED
jgi:hypothetical protein